MKVQNICILFIAAAMCTPRTNMAMGKLRQRFSKMFSKKSAEEIQLQAIEKAKKEAAIRAQKGLTPGVKKEAQAALEKVARAEENLAKTKELLVAAEGRLKVAPKEMGYYFLEKDAKKALEAYEDAQRAYQEAIKKL